MGAMKLTFLSWLLSSVGSALPTYLPQQRAADAFNEFTQLLRKQSSAGQIPILLIDEACPFFCFFSFYLWLTLISTNMHGFFLPQAHELSKLAGSGNTLALEMLKAIIDSVKAGKLRVVLARSHYV